MKPDTWIEKTIIFFIVIIAIIIDIKNKRI